MSDSTANKTACSFVGKMRSFIKSSKPQTGEHRVVIVPWRETPSSALGAFRAFHCSP